MKCTSHERLGPHQHTKRAQGDHSCLLSAHLLHGTSTSPSLVISSANAIQSPTTQRLIFRSNDILYSLSKFHIGDESNKQLRLANSKNKISKENICRQNINEGIDFTKNDQIYVVHSKSNETVFAKKMHNI